MGKRNIFFAFVCLVLLAPLASAQNRNIIRGKVRSTNGNPVNGAIVELRVAGGGALSQTATHGEGDFEFSGLTSAEYEIAVSATGYDSASQRVHFNHGDRDTFEEVLNVEFTVRPTPTPNLPAPGVNYAQDVPREARMAYEKGIARLSEGKSDEGVGLLRQAVSIFNDYFNANYSLALELYRTGKLQDSLEALERARQINDRDPAVWHLFGLLMIRQQKFAVAEYGFGEALKLDSRNPATHFYHGVTLIEVGIREKDPKESGAALAQAEKELNTAWDPSQKRFAAVYLELARIHERRGETEAAARDLDNFLKTDPSSKRAEEVRNWKDRLSAKKK